MRRQLVGVSQEFLAKQVGVDPGTLARWEAGIGAPTNELRDSLDRFLDSLAKVLQNKK